MGLIFAGGYIFAEYENAEDENMSEEKNGQNGRPRRKKTFMATIIAATITVLGGIITTILLISSRDIEVRIILINSATEKNIPGEVLIDGDKNPTKINPAGDTAVFLKRGSHHIIARSEGYHLYDNTIDRVATPLEIRMNEIAVITNSPTPLSLVGWRPWGNGSGRITLNAAGNECVVNSNGRLPDAAGFNSPSVTDDLQGKTLVLHFSNTQASRYSENRMVKVECNMDPKKLLRPVGVSTLNDGYIPNGDTPPGGIEFLIPDDFDGKLEFTFYQAELNDLKIAAYYK